MISIIGTGVGTKFFLGIVFLIGTFLCWTFLRPLASPLRERFSVPAMRAAAPPGRLRGSKVEEKLKIKGA